MSEEKQTLTVEELSTLLPEGYALVEKDGWVPREEVETRMKNLTFDRTVDLELTKNGAKSLTAARALLDLKTLRENPEGVYAAIGKIKRENDWLFQREFTFSSGAGLIPKKTVDTDSMSDAEYYAYKKQMKG